MDPVAYALVDTIKIQQPKFSDLNSSILYPSTIAINPDKTKIYYNGNGSAGDRLYSYDIASNTHTSVGDMYSGNFHSTDGIRIAGIKNNKVYSIGRIGSYYEDFLLVFNLDTNTIEEEVNLGQQVLQNAINTSTYWSNSNDRRAGFVLIGDYIYYWGIDRTTYDKLRMGKININSKAITSLAENTDLDQTGGLYAVDGQYIYFFSYRVGGNYLYRYDTTNNIWELRGYAPSYIDESIYYFDLVPIVNDFIYLPCDEKNHIYKYNITDNYFATESYLEKPIEDQSMFININPN